MLSIWIIKNKNNKNIGIIPRKTMKDRIEECGSRKDSGLLTTTSPYSWPKFNGPDPNKSSINVGLNLEKNSPHISDLFKRKAKLLKNPKIYENADSLSVPLLNNLR